MYKAAIDSTRPNLSERATRCLFALCALIMLGLCALLVLVAPAYADDINTIDISGSGSNTKIEITESGAYRLVGESSSAWVDVRVGGVDLYLADGLKMTPGAKANEGISCSSIKIEDNGGTVNIITEAAAQVELTSYKGCAPIQKDGISTELVFSTADAENPGSITAKASDDSRSAGIGTGYKANSDGVAGNLVFRGGKIIATGGSGAAGIGGANGSSVDGITIEGAAEIEAHGTGGGAGIGSGLNGTMQNIAVKGGSVKAYGDGADGGAGIGCGRDELGKDSGSISIQGGTVYAQGGSLGAGIGGAGMATLESIKISGGTVEAHGGNNGCGIGNGAPHEGCSAKYLCKSIVITGGNITAYGGERNAPAIGNDEHGAGRWNISISGGTVRAYAQAKHEYAIGGGGYASFRNPYVSVDISGGTILAVGGSKASAFGSHGDNYGTKKSKYFSATITGGSILASASNSSENIGTFQVTPKNAAGQEVKPMFITLGGQSDTVVDLSDGTTKFEGLSGSYGMHDASAVSMSKMRDADGDKSVVFYPWVNSGVTLSQVTAHIDGRDVVYSGEAKTGGTATFWPSTHLVLKTEKGGTEGSADAIYGGGVVNLDNAVVPYKVVEYYVAGSGNSNNIVLETDGKLGQDVVANSERLTAEDSRTWVYSKGAGASGGGDYTLYAHTREYRYTLHYDANVPSSASGGLTGELPDDMQGENERAYLIGEGSTIALAGYEFLCWNTKADGSGRRCVQGDPYANFADKDDETITLYAQWKPKTYTVSFDKGSAAATGAMSSQTFTVGNEEELPLQTFDNLGYAFAGWQVVSTAGSLIADGGRVFNLCQKNEDGSIYLDESSSPVGLTLRAVWVHETEGGRAAVAATKDGQTVSGLASRLTLVSGETSFAPYEEVMTSDLTYYRVKEETSTGGTIPAGIYDVYLDGKNTGTFVYYGITPASFELVNYCTLSVRCDDNLAGVDVSGEKSAVIGGDTVYVEDSPVTLTARESGQGNAFDRWSALGRSVDFAQGSSATANPTTILVQQSQVVRADAKPIEYAVSFDANASDATGSMDDQKFTYGETAKLAANGFTRTGYAFAGWNTAADGSGTAYKDEASVKNLSGVAATVTLYAQWKPITYFVHFDANFGGGVAMQSLEIEYGQTFNLPPCTFTFENEDIADSKFLGWNTSRDGSGTAFADEQSVQSLCDTQDASIVLYAQWEDPNPSYTVAFDANADDATGEMAPQQVLCGEKVTLNACVYMRGGYAFAGWNTKADGSGTAYDDQAEVSDMADSGKTATLYAQWKKDTEPSPDPDPEPTPTPGGDSDEKGSSKTKTKTSTSVARGILPTTGDDLAARAEMSTWFALVGVVCIAAARRLRLR